MRWPLSWDWHGDASEASDVLGKSCADFEVAFPILHDLSAFNDNDVRRVPSVVLNVVKRQNPSEPCPRAKQKANATKAISACFFIFSFLTCIGTATRSRSARNLVVNLTQCGYGVKRRSERSGFSKISKSDLSAFCLL